MIGLLLFDQEQGHVFSVRGQGRMSIGIGLVREPLTAIGSFRGEHEQCIEFIEIRRALGGRTTFRSLHGIGSLAGCRR